MRIHKDGNQIVPILYDWWRRKEKPSFAVSVASGNVLDLKRIEQRVDNLEYSGVTDFIVDVQSMLKSIVRHCNYTYEVYSASIVSKSKYFFRVATDKSVVQNDCLISFPYDA